jgi:hypothetical protein
VPENVKGNLKFVGALDGWPFAVKADPTIVKR